MTTQRLISKPLPRCLLLGLTWLWVLTLAFCLIQPVQAQSTTPGYVVAWGFNEDGQANVPAGLSNVTAIAAGSLSSLALKSDGTVVAWGNNSAGQTSVPAGLSSVTAIAAGGQHSLALKSNGTVVAWGCGSFYNYGQCSVPAGLSGVSAIAAGGSQSLALKNDGTVVAWGCGSVSGFSNNFGQCSVPTGLSGVIAITAGLYHSLALKNDGTVVAWGCGGGKDLGQCAVPSGLSGVIAIEAGDAFNLALKNDGTVVAWGSNSYGQITVPTGLSGIKAIAAGGGHSLALKHDGTVVGWGQNTYGNISMPAWLRDVTAISAGSAHGLALTTFNDTTPPTANPRQSPTASVGGWTDSDVTVTWRWSDNTGGSGIDTTHCTTSSTSSGEGTQTLTATCRDKVGNVGSANYTVKIDKTAPVANPTQSPAANAAGWNNVPVTVNWNWTDPSPGSGTGSGIDPGLCETTSSSSQSNGAETLTAICIDQLGHLANASYTVKVDRAAPQIRATVSPSPSGFGWYASAVTVSFICQEQGEGSGLATNTVGGNISLSSEGTHPAVTNTGACADNAGNVATSVTVGGFNIDLTKPTISAAATTQPNANGWYNSNVTIHYTCADALSGIAFCPGDEVLSSEGSAVASTVQTSRDKALNVSNSSNVVTVKLDKTAPVVTVTGVGNGVTYAAGNVPTAGCSTSDALSGVATQATVNVTGGENPSGPKGAVALTATCSGAIDQAGNSTAPTSVSYTVNALITNSVSQQSVSTVYVATPQSCPSTGSSLPQQTITPVLRNGASVAFSGLFFSVKTIEYTATQPGQPVLCNATSGNGGAGSTLAIPDSSLPGGDSQFNPGEDLSPLFQVGLPVRAQFRIFVDLYAVGPAAAATDGTTQADEYLGSFVYTFDAPQANEVTQLFLPLITR